MTNMNLTAPRAAESGHWYGRDGTPVYEVRGKNGQMRPATLADARKMGLYPGCTSIIKCAAAPGLERWKRDQVLLAALTIPRVVDESDESLCARILRDSEEQARKARDRGTEIHAAIQSHYEGVAPSEDLWPYVKGVTESIAANFGEQEWIAEMPVAHASGFGTKSDLHCPGIVLDFKGSEFDKEKAPSLKLWDEHAMQLAATRQALGLPLARCAIVYVSRTTPGLARIIEVNEDYLQQGWLMFQGLLSYWQASKNYWPQMWKEAA